MRLREFDALVSRESGKAALFAETRAQGADMESHVVAELARSHGIPFTALRCVADPARYGLPAAASCSVVRENGTVELRSVFASVMAQPGQIPNWSASHATRGRRSGAIPLPQPRRQRLCRTGFRPACARHRLKKTNCAGRCRSSGMSGAIGPSVRTPRAMTLGPSRAFCAVDYRRSLKATMNHAVGAFFVIADAVGVPVRFFHQLTEGFRIAFAQKITGALPAEDSSGRIAPGRTVVGLIAGQKIEEHCGLGERPLLAAAATRENPAEQLPGLFTIVGRKCS